MNRDNFLFALRDVNDSCQSQWRMLTLEEKIIDMNLIGEYTDEIRNIERIDGIDGAVFLKSP